VARRRGAGAHFEKRRPVPIEHQTARSASWAFRRHRCVAGVVEDRSEAQPTTRQRFKAGLPTSFEQGRRIARWKMALGEGAKAPAVVPPQRTSAALEMAGSARLENLPLEARACRRLGLLGLAEGIAPIQPELVLLNCLARGEAGTRLGMRFSSTSLWGLSLPGPRLAGSEGSETEGIDIFCLRPENRDDRGDGRLTTFGDVGPW